MNAAKTDDGEAEADERDDSGDRHAAWASRNGTRRFSLVGLPKGLIGKWKAIHRTLRTEDHPADLDPTFRSVRRAMKKGQWKRALIMLGAFSKGDRLTTRREEQTDCWGGTYTATAAIVNPRTGNEILLRPVRWQLVDKKSETESGLSIVTNSPREDFETVADSPSHALAGMEGIGKEGKNASGLQDFDGWRAMMKHRRAERAAA
ncbi:hypothetical protein H261_20447 [Paramagnetospirillum caucaseum]|uniref:Uncharacterized protein n=1 Tax=Paramagnetospirillum caucaseum TaxID=1244869 RepID=M2Y4N8_9PROT|nr:hypothetical protein [Paramagnetospirillum caucaseum]EME68051.1 hypothetical protein H261_20447 [Paramagnetospirillum caucaseum]